MECNSFEKRVKFLTDYISSNICDMDSRCEILKKLTALIYSCKGNINIENLIDLFEDEDTVNYLSGIMSYDFEISDVNKCIEDVIVTYRKEYLLQKRNSILSKIDKAEQENLTREEIAELEEELNKTILSLAKIK